MKLAKVLKSARTTKIAIRHLVLAVENLEKTGLEFPDSFLDPYGSENVNFVRALLL